MGVIVSAKNMMYDPDVIAVCLNCGRPRCVTNCDKFARACEEAAKKHQARRDEREAERGKLYELNGESHTLAEWAAKAGIQTWLLRRRIADGMELERALNPKPAHKPRQPGKYRAFGEMHTMAEWAEIYGIKLNTLNHRIYHQKMTLEDALTKPYGKRTRKTEGVTR